MAAPAPYLIPLALLLFLAAISSYISPHLSQAGRTESSFDYPGMLTAGPSSYPSGSGGAGSDHGPNWDYSWGWGSGPGSGWGYGSGSGSSSSGSIGRGSGYGFGYGSGSGGGAHGGGGYGSGFGSGSSGSGGKDGWTSGPANHRSHPPSDSVGRSHHGP